MIHFQDLRGPTSLRRRNRSEITVFVCEPNPYPM